MKKNPRIYLEKTPENKKKQTYKMFLKKSKPNLKPQMYATGTCTYKLR